MLLWYDDSGTTTERIRRAIRRYEQKNGQKPNICYVHPDALAGDVRQVDSVRLEARPFVLRGHWQVGRVNCNHSAFNWDKQESGEWLCRGCGVIVVDGK